MNKTPIIILVVAFVIVGIYLSKDSITKYFFAPRNTPSIINTETLTKEISDGFQVVAENLNIPWDIAFLPDGDMLVTERSGKLLKVGKDTKVIKEIEGVKHYGEGGLLGIALHPKFSTNGYVYLYFTYQDGNQTKNKLERYIFKNDNLTDKVVVLDQIMGSIYHDGGKIAFGPDGYLYVTTGDAQKPDTAQDKNSLNGKILRLKDDGAIPSDNPFGNATYSMGHRNVQGLVWDKDGNLWATEHGPTGVQMGNDEVNLIVKGGNYGWPTIKGTQTKEGMITPIIESTTKDTWAPAGIIYYDKTLYFTGLRGQAIYKAKIESGNKLNLTTLYKSQFGRLRAIVIGPDGYVYVTTSNKDGRGNPKSGDDKILKISIKSLLVQ